MEAFKHLSDVGMIIDADHYLTLADLAEFASVRQNCVAERLGALVKLKLITKTPGIARSIRPV